MINYTTSGALTRHCTCAYHLFCSLRNSLAKQQFPTDDVVWRIIDEFITLKDQVLFFATNPSAAWCIVEKVVEANSNHQDSRCRSSLRQIPPNCLFWREKERSKSPKCKKWIPFFPYLQRQTTLWCTFLYWCCLSRAIVSYYLHHYICCKNFHHNSRFKIIHLNSHPPLENFPFFSNSQNQNL